MIRYGKQHIDKADINSVVSVLKSDWITQGPKVNEFESKLKKKFGSKFCCVVSNGTAALHLTALALGWSKQDTVLCSPISFLSASNAVIYSGAKPDFVDINTNDYNIDTEKLKKKIQFYLKKNKKIKAIIATDFAGQPCDWKELKKISKKYKITLINDNCHAIGAKYFKNEKYASKYADIVTHSYHPVKNITTGEGGAVLTNNEKIHLKIKLLRSHGVIKSKKFTKEKPWFYQMQELGFNYRLTDIQCALGITQLLKISKFIKRRNQIAKIYNKFFSKFRFIKTPKIKRNNEHAFHIYPLLIDFKKLGITRSNFFKKLSKYNIFLQVHYIPIYLQPYYKKKFNFNEKNFPISKKFYSQEASLPIFYSLEDRQIYKICRLIKKVLKLKYCD